MKEKTSNNKGITLIALIITIIVMLILAGVTISMSLGEDGIIEKAKEAKDKTELALAEERVNIALTTLVNSGGIDDDDAVISTFHELNPDINKNNFELALYGAIPLIDNLYYCLTDYNIDSLKKIEIVEGNAADWVLEENGGMKTIIGYIGPDIEENETLVVPNMINGERIVAISGSIYTSQTPFDGKNIEGTIKISDGVSIGSAAFAYTNIHSIDFPNVILFGDIGTGAFFECNNLVTIDLTDGVKTVGIAAFNSCLNLETVIMSDSVIELKRNTFSGCSKLQNVTFSKKLRTIGDDCFHNCTNLVDINLPNSVTSIGEDCFRSCTSLTDITIPSKVTVLARDAFEGCTSLESITILSKITKIDPWCFDDCTSLKSIEIPSSITSISETAFSGTNNLTTIILHKSQASAPAGAPWGATNATIVYDE